MPATVGYLAALLLAFTLSNLLTPAVRRLAQRLSVTDQPGRRKVQHLPVPLLGGLAMAAGFSLVLLGAVLISPPDARVELAAFLTLALVIVLLGLADDLRGLSPWTRLTVELLVGAAAWAAGLGIGLSEIPPIDLALTMGWVAVITNAFNLLDNMDGLSSGVAGVAGFWLLLIAGANGQYLVALLAAAVAGCALGFLRHNFYPARIYMGDAGALFLGFCLAVLGMKLRFAGPAEVTFFVPVLLLGVPLMDTSLVLATRLAARRSPFAGGRDHLSHRIVALGVPVSQAVTGIIATGVVFGWTALVMSRVDTGTAFVLMGLVLTACTAVGALLSLVPTERTEHVGGTTTPSPAGRGTAG